MYKVSVIIPVYNIEEYIEECIQSLINQTLKDIEIIVVDDGTPDKSIEKIKYLMDLNPNIQVIHKDNGGLSSARNAGLKYARGKYVSFIDGDDFIKPDFLEQLYNEAEKYDLDITCGGYTTYFTSKTEKAIERKRMEDLVQSPVLEGKSFLKIQLENYDYRMEVWDDLYRREFLLENKLSFIEGLLHEDEEFTPKALLKAKRVKLVNNYGYMYRQRENSIMSSGVNIKNISSIRKIIDEFLLLFKQSNDLIEKECLSRLIIQMSELYYEKVLMSKEPNKFCLARKMNLYKITKGLYKNHLSFKGKLKCNIPYLYLIWFMYEEVCNRDRMTA